MLHLTLLAHSSVVMAGGSCSSLLINSFFKFGVSLFLDCLSILKFLNQFHFKHLHLHNFLLFLLDNILFLCNLTGNFFSSLINFLFSKLLNLYFLNTFLLFLNTIFKLFFFFILFELILHSCFILLINKFGLFSFFLFVQEDCISDF